ncbi:YwmB family TATA-box binding protein [Tenuibacillus multivorans]|uniref:TATA-box binding n=1 Tax=Tenuibacillus multivorans TaxID=237069 RepID=A0A1G9X3H6_9BACI|nr:YwmB family TATA-box binding protein [Tenuibacillus multivorans]GEL77243.1 hypothetical protein TMU01_14780 [Tenuibacillus multivorans]SDM91257.1 TATA-box binding [Tenuibacillus multivorans]
MRFLLIVALLVSSIPFFYQSSSSALSDLSAADDMAKFFEEQNWEINHTGILIHTKADRAEAEAFIEKMQGNAQKPDSIDEQYDVVPLNQNLVKVIYELTSDGWNQDVKKYLENQLSNDNFRQFFKNGQIFSCFQSNFDGKIKSNFITNKIVNYFDVKNTKVIDEEKFIVISGISDQFEQYIPMDEGKINIQFAVREGKNNKKTVTIGTPILVIEY